MIRLKYFVVLVVVLSVVINVSPAALAATAAKKKSAGLSAKSYAVMEYNSQQIVMGRNSDVKLPMASTTKIMTALITLEQPKQDEEFTVDSLAIMTEGSSMGLVKGDKVTLKTLAYGMLLASGNDAANAAAVRIGKTKEGFVQMMNDKAKELSMNSTHFTNPSGLPDSEHYSTAEDMAKLARAALQNPDFVTISSTKQAKLLYGNPPYTRYLKNHNKLLWSYDGAIGLKTGFTKKAGRCLVSAAKRDNQTVICVTLNAPSDWSDHTLLLNEGFKKCKADIIKTDKKDIYINTVDSEGNETQLEVQPSGIAVTYLPDEYKKDIKQKVQLLPFYYAPIEKGAVVGKLLHIYKDRVIATQKLVTATS